MEYGEIVSRRSSQRSSVRAMESSSALQVSGRHIYLRITFEPPSGRIGRRSCWRWTTQSATIWNSKPSFNLIAI